MRAKPTLSLDFLRANQLDPRVTFTRNSSATRVNRLGFIESVPAHQPRFDYDPLTKLCRGLLIEETRTNSAFHSNDPSQETWVKNTVSVTTNAALSPDGTTNASMITVGNGSNTFLSSSQSGSISAGQTWTRSIYAKAGSSKRIILERADTGASGRTYGSVVFDLLSGSIVTTGNGMTAQITPVGNGWYRCSATYTFVASGGAFANIYVDVYGSGTPGRTVYIYGTQLEQGAFPTSYIPTAGSAVTRAGETVDIIGAAFTPIANLNEGTIVCDFAIDSTTDTYRWPWSLGDVTRSFLGIFKGPSLGQVNVLTCKNNATTDPLAQPPIGTITNFNPTTIALSYVKGGNVEACMSRGIVVGTGVQSAFSLVGADRIRLGRGDNIIQGYIRSFKVYPRKMFGYELQSVSFQ